MVNETLSPDPIVEPKQNTSSGNCTLSTIEPSSPLSLVSVNPPLENIPKVSTLDMSSNISDLNTLVRYTLPFKENHGKPPTRYSPNIE